MAKYVKIITKVDPGADERSRMFVERIGEDDYRLTICPPEKLDFGNRDKTERFDREFVSKFNEACEREDQFELTRGYAFRELANLRKRLAGGEAEIRFRVRQ